MKRRILLSGVFFLGVSLCSVAFSQANKLPKGTWKMISESEIAPSGTRYIKPTKFLTFKLDVSKMHQVLSQAKRIDDPNYIPVFIELPKPDGTVGSYQVHENETMSPGLAAQFPEIRSYDGIAMDNSGEVVKFDLTPQGFHAMTLIPGKSTVFIDPYSFGGGDIEHYVVYSRADYTTDKVFTCQVEAELGTEIKGANDGIVKSFGNCTKRTYRLALAATAEYTTFQGGTVALAQAAQVTTMNRVNGVYMRDLAVTLTIIPNNNLLIYTNASTDPYTNGNPGSMINQNQTNVTSVIGSANYDIGHVFGTNSGGLAGLGVVCNSGQKASGVTGSGAPVGDAFDIDYVAHEMGHEFSGNHSFRGNAGSCSGNANGPTAMEPGSGSSIMAYAGICSPQDVQPHSDDNFHGVNMNEMHIFINGSGNSCAVSTPIPAQSAPVISGTVGSVTIPASTPFALTATATDADGDVLTYCWEQMDNQNSTQPPVGTSTNGPNFRSRTPSTSGTRYFPSIASLMSGGPFTWEVLPTVSRTMNFRCTVRDNEANGGCNDHADLVITTTASAGPFIVNYPTASGISWPGNSTQTVTWSVANTNVAPVACANVDVMISTDGGATFSVIANDVPNDGSQVITVPNTATTTAIIMVMCENGTFFDVSNNVFAITAATNDYTLNFQNSTVSACQGTDAVFTVVVGQIGSYSDPVTLSATGNPAGTTVTFTPNPATPGTNATMTISNTAGATPGTYSLTANGTSTSGAHFANGTVLISTSGVVAATLTSPANAATSVPVSPNMTWTNPGVGVQYNITIASDAGFTTVVESATGLTSPNYTATLLSPATTYYWKVETLNSCSAPAASATFSFTTASCMTFNATNVPVTISASGTPTVTSTLSIAAGGTINDLDVVNLAGTHSWINDLTVTLTSPAGTVVTLWDQICDDEDNFNVNFDDEAAPGALPCPPVGGGTYQAQDLLSAFDGENMSGVWTLTISDAVNQDGGSLSSWGLQICYTPAAPCTPPTAATIGGSTTICPGGSTTLSVTAGTLNDATNWQWYSGSCGGTAVGSGTSINVSTAGTYFVRGEGGCVTGGTCTSVAVTQTTLNLNTTVAGTTISSAQGTATYQWINCTTNTPISGANGQSYIATANGSYAVIVTRNGCTDTSACVNITNLGIDDLNFEDVSVYPNPTNGKITVSFNKEVNLKSFVIRDVTGRLIREEKPQTTSGITFDISTEAQGVYFLNIEVGGSIQSFKLIKN
ncbi:reprolysin-like metallopeptidase [Fluviicola sp.]|uniref:reprolysin-like metallopeptidase n=1 Tax=Fluviicola sp. TaxID=1917219 RepID=UPI0031D5D679